MDIILEGIDKLTKALTEAGVLAEQVLAEAMVSEMETVLAEAKALAPVDTGALRDSAVISPPKVEAGMLTVEAGFTAWYARIVHERLGVHHPSGEAKFLERPFLAKVPVMPEEMAVKLRAAWARLGR